MIDQPTTSVRQMYEADSLGSESTTQSQGGEYMSLQQASNVTGWSMGTLRRYIKARKLKSRRLGRSFNSKLEVWITPDMLADQPGESPILDTEDATEGLIDDSDDDYPESGNDQSDQSVRGTLAWMQNKLDEKDLLLREKDDKIEKLMQEIAGATYRNGYLEARKEEVEARLLLLEDKTRTEPTVEKKNPSAWSRFSQWFIGKSN